MFEGRGLEASPERFRGADGSCSSHPEIQLTLTYLYFDKVELCQNKATHVNLYHGNLLCHSGLRRVDFAGFK